MGCDGGTIPKRHELVKTRKKPEEKDKQSDLAWKWQYCAVSNQMLKEPIVACELGRLYNKDAIIEYLLDKQGSSKMDKMKHIKGLKDVHTLKLSKNQAWEKRSEKGDGYIDTHLSKYICPVAGLEMNGKYKFCYLLSCNCVLSERALKQVRGDTCPSCSKEYSKENDVIVLNAAEDEEVVLNEKMQKRKEDRKKSKKDKKKNKSSTELTNEVDQVKAVNGINKHSEASNPDVASTSTSSSTSTSGDALASGRVKNLSATSTVQGAKHKLKEEKIFQTNAFKSLFTSHSSAKRAKDKNGHWITYNPYHYAG